MTPAEKLNKLLSYYSTTKNELGVKINKRQSLYDINNGKIKSFSAELVAEIIKVYPDINYDWLLYDRGEMLNVKRTKIKESNSSHKSQGEDDESKFQIEVILIPAEAQSDLQSFLYAEEIIEGLERKIIYLKHGYKSKYYEIEFVGESMNDGSDKSIKAGDFVLCREISKLFWKDAFYTNDREYIFFHNEFGIILGKIEQQYLESGGLLLSSYNENKYKYADFIINIKDCYAICDVLQITQNRW